MRTRRLLHALVAVVLLVALPGCIHVSWSGDWSGGETISYGTRSDVVQDLATTVVDHRIAVAADETVRIRNLAGRVELIMGDGPDVEILAHVYAKGWTPEETHALLDTMVWREDVDDDGQPEWTLAYPVDAYRTFHYSTDAHGFSVETHKMYGRKVQVTTARKGGVPTVFADLTIVYPADATLRLRNLAGDVAGGDLLGTADIAVTAGDVTLGSFAGSLDVDTGAGEVTIQRMDGSSHIDTGSGDIRVASLYGTSHLDTGSGDIIVDYADADRVHADTGSGDIALRGGRIAEIHADTGSGAIDILDVVFEVAFTDTGSGSIAIRSDLAQARSIHADTGSGSVTIRGGDHASFIATASQGSGRFHVGYDDAAIRYDGRRPVGAKRGDGRTVIHMDTGSGDCTIRP